MFTLVADFMTYDLFGMTSGANVVAAIRVAEQLGPDSSVTTLMIDSGLKYLSSNLFSK